MHTEGTLTKWNSERGFGLITPRRGGQDIAVQVADFPQDGCPPQLNERLSFSIETDAGGKRWAKNVARAGAGKGKPTADQSGRRSSRRSQLATLLAPLALLLAIGAYGYIGLYEPSAPDGGGKSASTGDSATQAVTARFFCDGRTSCDQMTSCEEATFFLRHCPGVTMDDDQDGVPCEEQWCVGVSR